MKSYKSEVIGPPEFLEDSDEYQVEALRDRIPHRWRHGGRDSVESIFKMLGTARDHGLYRKVGAETWADYCSTFLFSRTEAINRLIAGVRILNGEESMQPKALAERIIRENPDYAREVLAALKARLEITP